MPLDLTQINELGSFLNDYQEEFKKAEVRKVPIDLAPGTYTGKLTNVFLDKMPDGSRYMLKWEILVLTAEPQNLDQIDNLTQRTNWININDSTKLLGDLQRIKQAFYDVGYLVNDIKQVIDPSGNLLRSLKGTVVQFNVQHNKSDDGKKTFVNLYINKVVSKAEVNSNTEEVNSDSEPF